MHPSRILGKQLMQVTGEHCGGAYFSAAFCPAGVPFLLDIKWRIESEGKRMMAYYKPYSGIFIFTLFDHLI